MLVKSQCFGNRVTGLYVGENNVSRYFPRKVKAINLQLDHLQIECGLAPRFWDGEPEIHDPRLCLWLESKQSRDSNCRWSMPLYMIPAGEGTFVLGFAEPHSPVLKHNIEVEFSDPDLDLELELANLETGAAA
jgi:hypothetical protein